MKLSVKEKRQGINEVIESINLELYQLYGIDPLYIKVNGKYRKYQSYLHTIKNNIRTLVDWLIHYDVIYSAHDLDFVLEEIYLWELSNIEEVII